MRFKMVVPAVVLIFFSSLSHSVLRAEGGFQQLPAEAPDWVLNDSQGKLHKLSDYRGKNVVVVFFLGFGCLHCVEQIDLFGKHQEEFDRRGVTVVGISSEPPGNLRHAVNTYGEEPPFLLMSDYFGSVFKKYHCIDDGRKHGTFLVDANGRIRWQQVGDKPYTNVQQLLNNIDTFSSSIANPAFARIPR